MLSHILYILVFLSVAVAVPAHRLAENASLVLTMGTLGMWRYGWGAINFVRATIFIHIVHPRRRAAVTSRYLERQRPAHSFFLVTTYKVDTAVTARVYRSLFNAAAASRGGATVVASIVDTADERLIRRIYSLMKARTAHVRLIIDRIPATGKRDALATSLRIIARQCPMPDDIVVLIDGDSCPPEDLVETCAPFFVDPKIGAVTTDEDCEIEESRLFRDWFNLRFTQRHMMMSSMGLSGRVLTLTGRLSIFRASLACDPDFIDNVQHDWLAHWRLGTVKFLTGDDKSTWFWLLKRGYEMAYLPDVRSVSMESQPKPGFVDSAVALMLRWFGNMLRTNGRALALGPHRVGWFTWWSVLDQRISMWTTLFGPATVVMSAVLISPLVLPLYLAWVMFTRYIYCCLLTTFRPAFPITYPFLLYFSQISGALVKTFVLFRLDRQKWTRQSTARRARRSASLSERLRNLSSTYVHMLASAWLLFAAFMISTARM
ncbi:MULTISPECIES: glycosyltransferase [Rhizobium]|uniref:Glycosyltransferase alg8 n=1 Tax=Rhizobium favelukesii TaxID=348824 RepID=W6RNE3_9HYPH|nr:MULTISPECIES: glycosyltransferase [Rhizobium]MCS0460573.1 glycosyltransferase family 2 protein [Rhizobium favelukesii]UFS79108.1 glycosyltransferase family 2 protein [Rhizobium sp. T136]CDM62607.1 Glycosyltransferase alg8 [Rhizobium favelukesii]